MNEFYGVSNDKHYICNKDFNECFVFDGFGKLVNAKGSILECRVISKVDILSVIPMGRNKKSYCEVYFNGMKKQFHKDPTLVIYQVRTLKKFLGTIYRVKHTTKSGAPLFDQLVLVLRKGEVSFSDIDRLNPEGMGDWIPIKAT